MEKYEEYYKLGVRYANKLIDASFSNNPYLAYKQLNKRENEREKAFHDLLEKEYCYFDFNSLTVLLGLNKEKVEEIGKDLDYNYDLSKNGFNFEGEYNFVHSYEGKYKEWLNVIKCDHPINDYIFNVRNGLLHSEFEPSSKIFHRYNVRNSNYTGFEGEIYLPSFSDFVTFYFGNFKAVGKTSINPNMLSIYSNGYNKKINDENELFKFLQNAGVGVINQDYINKTKDIKNTPEYKISKSMEKYGELRGVNDLFKVRDLTPFEEFTIMSYINNHVEDFYSYDFNKQMSCITSVCEFVNNPNNTISQWIINFKNIIGSYSDEDFDNYAPSMNFSTGLDKVGAVFLKLGFALYRMQYKEFEEIDYNLINMDFSKLIYKEDGDINGISQFVHAYNKIKMKDSNYTDHEIKVQIICDIIRNSIAHGKVLSNIDLTRGDVYVKFVDDYKGKTREITMSLQDLTKFVMSKAFDPSMCKVKEKPSEIHK